jgi:hypothetical protein
MTAMDKLIETIQNSSATPSEKLDILNALTEYIINKLN